MASAFDLSELKTSLTGEVCKSQFLKTLDLDGIANVIKEGKVKNIVTMAGAGISTSAGVPDFRSPSKGIYDNLEEFDLPHPMAVFSLVHFEKDPRPFFEVVRRLYKPVIVPTLCHYFIRLLHEKCLLRRHYTQNVDGLERESGIPETKLIEAHGTFQTGHCLDCQHTHDYYFLRDNIVDKKTIPRCLQCSGVVKPDVVFFGEDLPERFYVNRESDFSACDLLIICGTSLTVAPFCGLVDLVGPDVPRLYLNKEYCYDALCPLKWGEANNTRDVFLACDMDDGVVQLATLLGWKDELLNMKRSNDQLLASVKSNKSSV